MLEHSQEFGQVLEEFGGMALAVIRVTVMGRDTGTVMDMDITGREPR